jgi:hypothetical protein
MGPAISKNTMQSIVDGTIDVVTNIASNDSVKINQGQYIYAEGGGDVTISDVDMKQGGYVNLSSVSQMTNNVDIQNKITNQLSQVAESVSKGINLGNVSDAENNVSTLMQSTIQSINDFSKTCLVESSQSQELIAKAGGDVTIKAIKMSQLNNAVASCMSNILNNNKISNTLDNIVSQSASAKSIGIDPMMIFIAIAIIVVGTIGSITFAFKSALQYIIPIIGIILIVCGIVLVIKYKKRPKSDAKWYGFTPGIGKTKYCSKNLKIISTESDLTPDQVEKKFLSDEKCSVADWTTKETTFYSGDVSDECVKELSTNTGANFINMIDPKFFASDIDPNNNQGQVGNIFINTKTGKVSKRGEMGGWTVVVDLETTNFSVMCDPNTSVCTCDDVDDKKTCMKDSLIGKELDPKRQTGIIIVDAYNFLKAEKDDKGKFNVVKKMDGPGKVLIAKKPDEMNVGVTWTCIKHNIDDKGDLYSGMGMIGGGVLMLIIGVVIIFSSSKKSNPTTNTETKFLFNDFRKKHKSV